MSCRRARLLLEKTFDRSVTVEESFALSEHVRMCAACRGTLEVQTFLSESLDTLPEPPVERVDVEDALRRIRASITTPSAPAAARWPRVGVAAAAAVLLLGGVLGLRLLGSNTTAESEPRELPALTSPELTPSSVTPGLPDLAQLPDTAPTASEVDRGRLERAREEIGLALRSARHLLTEGDPVAFAAAVEAAVEDLGDWPVERIVARHARSDETELALPAVRYLGARSSRAVLVDLERALRRPDLERSAVVALLDAGAAGRSSLARNLWDLERSDVAVARAFAHAPLSPGERTDFVAACFAAHHSSHDRDSGGPDVSTHSAARLLVDALAESDRPGAEHLFALLGSGVVDGDLLLDALVRSTAADDVLDELLRAEHATVADEHLLLAVQRLRPVGALPWVAERVRDRDLAVLALDALASLPGTEPMRFLLGLHGSGRSDEELIAEAWRAALRRDPERVRMLALNIASGSDDGDVATMLELLAASGEPGAAPAIFVLAGTQLASDGDRALAVLAVPELGGELDPGAPRDLLHALAPRDRRTAAACLVTAHALFGDDAVRSLLADTELDPERILALLAQRARGEDGTVALFQLGARLTPLLDRRRREP